MDLRTYSGLRGTACDIFEDEQRVSKWMRVSIHTPNSTKIIPEKES